MVEKCARTNKENEKIKLQKHMPIETDQDLSQKFSVKKNTTKEN